MRAVKLSVCGVDEYERASIHSKINTQEITVQSTEPNFLEYATDF